MVTDGAVGEYKKDKFIPTEGELQIGDTVECLFAFSGSTARSIQHVDESLPAPRLLDIAAGDAGEWMLAACDPDGDGRWSFATPDSLNRVARLLAR
eukprot:2838788-Rhodomonas_salina.1